MTAADTSRELLALSTCRMLSPVSEAAKKLNLLSRRRRRTVSVMSLGVSKREMSRAEPSSEVAEGSCCLSQESSSKIVSTFPTGPMSRQGGSQLTQLTGEVQNIDPNI
jgi:hypothetical protein